MTSLRPSIGPGRRTRSAPGRSTILSGSVQHRSPISRRDLWTGLWTDLLNRHQVIDLSEASGGDGGIRTLDRALQPYNGLANRRLQPLGHVSRTKQRVATYARRLPPLQALGARTGARWSNDVLRGLCLGSGAEGRRLAPSAQERRMPSLSQESKPSPACRAKARALAPISRLSRGRRRPSRESTKGVVRRSALGQRSRPMQLRNQASRHHFSTRRHCAGAGLVTRRALGLGPREPAHALPALDEEPRTPLVPMRPL